MTGRGFWILRELDDAQLEGRLARLLGAGARLESRLVAHLAELDARKLHLRAGYPSLYEYCRRQLGLSDYEAYLRIAAARAAKRFPQIFGMLERRELTLTTVCEIRDFLNEENCDDLLREVTHKTKLEVREALAERFPRADIAANTRPMSSWDPLSPGRYKLEVTLSAEQKQKLEYARGLLGHAEVPGDLARVIERALDLLIARLERERFGTSATAKSKSQAKRAQSGEKERPEKEAAVERAPSPSAHRNHLPYEVRRQVVTRDGARCAFVGRDGHRCDSQECLEFHHRQPWAIGGPDTAENLQLFCRAHNQLVAELELGAERVGQAIEAQRARAGPKGEAA